MLNGIINIVAWPIISLLRIVFYTIDMFIYSLCGGFYEIAMNMYDINTLINTSSVISRCADVVYSFLAIFMFFKVAFSLLQMLVDPSLIEDKQKGAGKIVQNIMICLVLIVAVPVIFENARKVQTIVIEKEIIENAIYGETYSARGKNTNAGHKLAVVSWSLLMYPDPGITQNKIVTQEWKEAANVENATNSWNAFSNLIGSITKTDSSGHYYIKYYWGISTIFGIYLLWTFIKLAIDIAYRALKLFLLQIVSPIAIVSYIDPKSGKEGIFAKWSKECMKTYISLFLRIALYAVAGVLLVEITKSNLVAQGDGWYKKLVYILATLALIKSGPKMLDNIFGTEISKDSETKFASDMLRAAMGGVTGAAVAGIASSVVAKRMNISSKDAMRNIAGSSWNGMKKGYSAAQKGNLPGYVGSMFGTVNDTKKQFGYERDRNKERRIENYEQLVPEVDSAKAARSEQLSKDGNKEANRIIRSTRNVNGREYGTAVQGDEQLINAVKKNQSGLEKDLMVHRDISGFEEYSAFREQAAEADMAATVVQRTLDKANYDFQQQQSMYGSLATDDDRKRYIVNLATNNVQNLGSRLKAEYGVNAEGELKTEFAKTLAKERHIEFESKDRAQVISFISSKLGKSADELDGLNSDKLAKEYYRAVASDLSSQGDAKMVAFDSANNYADKLANFESHISTSEANKIDTYNSVQLNNEFTNVNADAVVSTYGNSLNNMTSDAAKAKGDADAAKAGLDEFLKSYAGKEHARADAEYKIGEEKAKANTNRDSHPWS